MPRAYPPAPRRAGVRAVRGFTLIELLVTLSVLAILIALAVPGFTAAINTSRLAGQANELVTALQLARMEAIRGNTHTIVCRSTDGATCASAGAQWEGWLTFVDRNGDGAPAVDASETVRVSAVKAPVAIRASDRITNNTGNSRVIFSADGLARAAGGGLLTAQFSVCIPTSEPANNQRLVSIASGSRIRSAENNGGGACTTPANP